MAECRIYGPDGFEMEPLVNPVVDLKKHLRKPESVLKYCQFCKEDETHESHLCFNSR